MIQVADALVKNDHKPATLQASCVYRHTRALLDASEVCCFGSDEEQCSTSVVFLVSKNQQTKIIFQYITSLFISAMSPFDYNAEDKPKKWKAKAEIQEKCLLLQVQRHFSPTENSSSSRGILGENDLKYSPRKRSLQNKRDKSSVQKVEIINLDDLEVASPPQKRSRAEMSATLSKIITGTTMKSSDDSYARHRSGATAVKPLQHFPL